MHRRARWRERLRSEAAAIASDARRPGRRRRLRRRDARRAAPTLDRRRRAAFGGADILINNAGTGSNETILEAPDEKWQHYWDLHVMAAVRLARGLAPVDEAARRRRHPAQRLDLRRPAALVRADLQRDQGGADDVLQDARQRAHPRQHPRQLRQPRPHPDARLDQDRKAAHRRQGRRLAGLSRRASPTSTRRSSASPRPRNWRTSSSSCAPTRRATPSARPTTSMAECCAPSPEPDRAHPRRRRPLTPSCAGAAPLAFTRAAQ